MKKIIRFALVLAAWLAATGLSGAATNEAPRLIAADLRHARVVQR